MSGCVVAIPVGPSDADVARTHDLLAALRAHEPGAGHVVLVDDAPAPRAWPDGVAVVPNPRRGRGIGTLGGTCTATLAALGWAHARARGQWVLRLDTDALVIGPFVDALEAEWRPGDGVLGSCRRTCNGEPRDLTPWAGVVRRHARPVWVWRHPPRRLRHVQPAVTVARRAVREALARGYEPGEHCIAAGCAISARMIAGMADRGWLDRPRRWLNTRLGDDIMLGIMARALGLDLRDMHSVFGLKHIGLADSPERLLERGFAVVHSVKNDPQHREDEIRAFFADQRVRGRCTG
jgi:hypothetical protein